MKTSVKTGGSVDFRLPFSLGMVATLAGAIWDAWRHLNGLATSESFLNPFLNPAHGTIYGGATIMALSLVLLRTGTLGMPARVGRKTYWAMLAGIGLLLGGGLYDFWWHTTFGFADATPWTPSHMTATVGFSILLITGAVGLSRGGGVIIKSAFALSVVLFIALWGEVLIRP